MINPSNIPVGYAGHMFFSSKTYDYNAGLSTAFRQWKAQSHCKYLHGYALRIELTFASYELDLRNFVVDFGGLKSFKQMLEDTFDHKTLVAKDDPHIEWFREGHRIGTMDVIEVDHTGCERMAEMVYNVADIWLKDAGYGDRVFMWEAWVREHSGNGAGFTRSMVQTVLTHEKEIDDEFERSMKATEDSIKRDAAHPSGRRFTLTPGVIVESIED